MELTGKNLLDSIIDSTGANVNALIYNTLSARLQQLIDDKNDSKMALSFALKGFSTKINEKTPNMVDLMNRVEGNKNIIKNASSQEELDNIDFPSINGNDPDPGEEPATMSLDNKGSITPDSPVTIDAGDKDYIFTDSFNQPNNVKITNFANGDKIQFDSSPGDIFVTSEGHDVLITTVDNQTVSKVTLVGIVEPDQIIDGTQQSLEAALGYDVFA